jgi:hypothetical protein
LLFDDKEHLWAFPEPRETALRAGIRRTVDTDECRRAFGGEPHAFCWATGACMLYARRAFETCGLFREDFWMLGEDLEFSMRVAAAAGGVFTADAQVPHLPPPPDPETSRVAHRLQRRQVGVELSQQRLAIGQCDVAPHLRAAAGDAGEVAKAAGGEAKEGVAVGAARQELGLFAPR